MSKLNRKTVRRFCLWLFVAALSFNRAEAVQFEVSLDSRVAEKPTAGRLYVLLTQGNREPRFGPDWFHPEPFFRLDVTDFAAAAIQKIDDSASGFPEKLSRLRPGHFRAQAVLARSFDSPHLTAAGNLFSRVVEFDVASDPAQIVPLTLDQLATEPNFPDIAWIKEVAVKSELLSQFQHREVVERAAVVLPAGYAEHPERRYPVLYEVPGFGGSHRDAIGRYPQPPQAGPGELEMIRVILSGQTEWGHHVYADSATNGPRGAALIKELIPAIDRAYRTVADPGGRFLAGHSSGGWSSLWLQVTYPDFFGGVWSTSPDPVDFREFQQIDLYADPPTNVYRDASGNRRPVARHGQTPALWFDSFTRMDDVLSRGGQLRSFEAAFSPLGAGGQPRRLWDRATGTVDSEVAKAWQAYDIRLTLERNWASLGPRLGGKLHVTVGGLDTFYLDGAVVRLAETLKRLGSDAQITVAPGKDHATVLTPEYFRQSRAEITAAFQRHQ